MTDAACQCTLCRRLAELIEVDQAARHRLAETQEEVRRAGAAVDRRHPPDARSPDRR